MSYQKGSVSTNILIGFESDDIFELFDSDSEDFGDITNLVTGNPNLFLFGYASPHNLMEMEHSYGANGKSGGGASTFNIKFIDPEVEFENNFLKYSTMQGAGIAAFSIDPETLQTVSDIKGSPYGTWWEDKFGEKYNEAKKAEDATVEKRSVAWGPTAGGEQQYSGRHKYLDGDTPGNPRGAALADGMYQELQNPTAYNQGVSETRWGPPAKLKYKSSKPSSAPQRFYHKEMELPLDQEKEIEQEALAEVRAAITSQQELLKSGATTKIFIAYGQGYDFHSWAGPFVTTMMDASNEYDTKGVRSLSVQLVANTGAFGSASREGALGASFGKKVKIRHEIDVSDFNAFGQGKIEQKSSEQVKKVVDEYKAEYGEGYGAAWMDHQSGTELSWGSDDEGARPYRFLAQHVPGDLHAIIRAIITKYLCATTSQNKIPMGNMIVLLPDLTKGLAGVQASVVTDVLTSNSVRELNEGKAWGDMENGLFTNGQVDTDGEVKAVAGISAQMHGAVSMRTVWGFQVVKKLVEMLGFEFMISTRYFGLEESPDSVETTMKYIDGLSFSAYKEFDPYDDWGWDDKNTSWSDSLLHFFGEIPSPPGVPPTGKTKKRFEIVLTNRYDENFEETLYRCLQDISANSSLVFEPSVIWETDTKILKLLKEFGVIESDKQPAVICGDKALIDQFVYGGIEFQTVFKQEQAVSNFLKHVHLADEERFSWSPKQAAVLQNAGVSTQSGHAGGFTEGGGNFPYCEAIFSKLYNISYGAFDKLYMPHSESAFEDIQKMTAAGIPIFRSGHKNSNILSMKCDLKPYYFAGLFTNFLAERGRPQQPGSGKFVSPDAAKARNVDIVQKSGLSPEDKEDLIALYTGKMEATQEALNTLNSITEEEFGFKIQTQQDYRDYMNFVLGITAGESTAVVKEAFRSDLGNPIELVLPTDGPRNSFLAVKGMIDTISKQSLECTIKTLPYFKLSGIHSLARPVVMNIRELQMAGTPYADDYSASGANAISTKLYSGFWNLYGFKHTITNKTSFSEFTLYKQPGETDPNYGKIDEISEEMMKTSIEATLETGEMYDIGQTATAEAQGGSAVGNLKKNEVQKLNQAPYPNAGAVGPLLP